MNYPGAGFICVCLLALANALPLAAQFEASAVIQYTAEEVVLGFTPYAMNNRGWIVGANARRYRPGVGTERLSNFSGRLTDINDAGTAVGYFDLDGHREAIIRPAGAPWQLLGTLGGRNSYAYAINEAGQVVGTAQNGRGEERPFLYTAAEGMKMLFDQTSSPWGINENGQVAGRLSFLWDPIRGLIDVSEPPGGTDRFYGVIGISDNGIVAGKYRGKLATFSLDNGLRVIGEQNDSLVPKAVNDRGWIVADGALPLLPERRALLYVYGQGLRDLNTLLVTPLPSPLGYAVDINDRDEILAFSDSSSGRRYYILKRVR